MEVVETHGSDALRVALLGSAVTRGADIRFSSDAVRDAVRRFHIPLWNSLHYFSAYASIDGFEPQGRFPSLTRLDRYLLGETERLRQTLEERMAGYDFAACYEAIEDWIVLLSTWYIRLSKQRLWGAGGLTDEKRTGFEVLYAALSTAARAMAPFLPFLAESVHGELGNEKSVHLEDWPAAHPEWRDEEVASEMRAIRVVVRLARSVREEHRLKHRHPLRSVTIAGLGEGAVAHNLDLLREELNVKEVRVSESLHVHREVKLDYGRLGKRLRGDVKKVQAAIDAGAYEVADGRLRAAGHELGEGDFSFRYASEQASEGVAAEGSLVVLLDLTSDPELIAEGQMRDLNRGLQDLRKRARLAYADRVVVSIAASPSLHTVIDAHRGWLADQVLATEISAAPMADALAREEIEVGDEEVQIALRRV
jgi:isoleucyl-tRNA synthetase